MKNRLSLSAVIMILLVAVLLPMLASCQHEAVYEEIEVPIYTIYAIKDASTTDEAVLAVELALNRTIFYRQGFGVKLMLYTEDEYDKAIADKYAEMEAYKLALEQEKEESKKNKTSAASVSAESEESKYVRTGDKLIEDLKNGIATELAKPRIDIFLVRNYDDYTKFVAEKKLAPLDEKLSSEAKLIKDYVHPFFLNAAKIDNKTYGVPNNIAIGNYEYIVFDSELLGKYGYDAQTMCSLEDLQEYLQIIKEKEPDVIPLLSATDSNEYAFMFENGFATFVDGNKRVQSTYEDTGLLEYLAMIARYNALGYLENAEGKTHDTDPNARFAVSFVKGDENTIDELSTDMGYEYDYNIYQVPTATNRNTMESAFCVSSYCVSNELIDVSELLTFLYTDSDIQNLFAYGVAGTNYMLDENGQVVFLDDTYRIDRRYTGNPFIAYTMAGEDPEKWTKVKQQNLASVISNTLGFSVSSKSFSYNDEEGKKVTVYEPDYYSILTKVIAEYYPILMKGTSVEFDLEEYTALATQTVRDNIANEIAGDYEAIYKASLTAELRAEYEKTDEAKEKYATAETAILKSVRASAKKKLRSTLTKELKEKYQAEGVEKSDQEITNEVNATLTDAYIEENLYCEYSREEVDSLIAAQYNKAIATAINKQLNEYIASDDYKAYIDAYKQTEEFIAELEARFQKNGVGQVDATIDSQIAGIIGGICTDIIGDFNSEIGTAIDEFVAEYAELLEMTEDELLTEIGFREKVIQLDADGNEDTDADPVYEDSYDSYYAFVWEGKIKKQYYQAFGDPDAVVA